MKSITQAVVLLLFPLFVITAFATELAAPGTGAAIQQVAVAATQSAPVVESFWEKIWNHRDVILAFLFATSEVIGLWPGIKQSSVYEIIVSALKIMMGKKDTPSV